MRGWCSHSWLCVESLEYLSEPFKALLATAVDLRADRRMLEEEPVYAMGVLFHRVH